jgi:ubiquinol-cytochrome c reductase iron-sulfur subunit
MDARAEANGGPQDRGGILGDVGLVEGDVHAARLAAWRKRGKGRCGAGRRGAHFGVFKNHGRFRTVCDKVSDRLCSGQVARRDAHGVLWRAETETRRTRVATTEHSDGQQEGASRRDFLYIATGTVGAVGIAGLAWPFIDQMNPDASQQALASIEVDVGALGVGESMTVMWRGKPIFIRNRTDAEIEAAANTPVDDLPDPDARNPNRGTGVEATDVNRTLEGHETMLVQIGICTHLGCVPLGQQGEFGGWFCPCHGSHYDTAGRIRIGPAPENLHIPPYNFTSDTTIVIG